MEGKAKELFEKWLLTQSGGRKFYNKCQIGVGIGIDILYLNDNEQWGVMQDFYDSHKIDIMVERDYNRLEYTSWVFDNDNFEYDQAFKTRPEARAVALEKAAEILEEKLKP